MVGGFTSYAFDFSAHIDANAWYATLVAGTLNLTPRMTWLQAAGYVSYLVPVLALYLRAVKPRAAGSSAASADVPTSATATDSVQTQSRKPVPRWAVGTAVVAVPVLAAAGAVAALGPAASTASAPTIEVSATACGKGWTDPKTGVQTFQMKNTGSAPTEVYLLDPATSAVYGEIEGLAPGTTRPLVATLGAGTYAWRCVPNGQGAVTSAAQRVTGTGTSKTAVVPIAGKDLAGPLDQYRSFVTAHLADVAGLTAKLKADVDAGDLAAAKTDWLPAHAAWSGLGAAYGTFGDFVAKIDGRADGLPGKVREPTFAGFHRLEYGLWHAEAAATLAPVADQLDTDVRGLVEDWPKQDFDPADLPLRSHEILEDTLQFELTADTDYGSGTNLATADANLAGTRAVLNTIRPLVAQRDPDGLAEIDAWLDRFGAVVDAQKHADGTWTPVGQLATADRQQINGTLGELLEKLAVVPDLLEIRKAT